MRLLDELAPPQLVTCDGDSGGLKALRSLWPDTPVQRCIEVSQVLFRLSRWENLEYAKKI